MPGELEHPDKLLADLVRAGSKLENEGMHDLSEAVAQARALIINQNRALEAVTRLVEKTVQCP